MTGFLDNAEIEIPCGKCGRKTKKTIGWVNSRNKFTCSCGVVIELKTDQFKREIGKANAAIDKMRDAFKSLGKR
jgi:hypothetical protein